MRLDVLDNGHRLRARLMMRIAPMAFGTGLDDVGKTSLYRPDLFGRPWLALLQDVMTGPSEWSRADRELLAAFVSNLNRCHYCVGIHTGTATILGERSISPELLERWRDADFDDRVRAAFALIEAVAADPDSPDDAAIDSARKAGLSDDAIVDAFAVAFCFNLINRLADAFGYAYGNEDQRLAEARALTRLAYKVPRFFVA
jgi:uncharacterized peroxidase-related enzyme